MQAGVLGNPAYVGQDPVEWRRGARGRLDKGWSVTLLLPQGLPWQFQGTKLCLEIAPRNNGRTKLTVCRNSLIATKGGLGRRLVRRFRSVNAIIVGASSRPSSHS